VNAYLIQTDIAWEDPTENFARVEAHLAEYSPQAGDLILLPEMFATGFSLNNDRTTPHADTILQWLTDLARRTGAYVQGGRTVAVPGDALAENRAPVLSPEGKLLGEYAKIHPFGFGREPEAIRGGHETLCWDWCLDRGGSEQRLRVGVGICYDLRFPELFRRLMLDGAEVFTVGANWPAARKGHWRALAIARAIENQAFMLAVNRCGSDPHLEYAGGTIAISPTGEILGELGDTQGVLCVEIDPKSVHEWRATFPGLRDVKMLG